MNWIDYRFFLWGSRFVLVLEEDDYENLTKPKTEFNTRTVLIIINYGGEELITKTKTNDLN